MGPKDESRTGEQETSLCFIGFKSFLGANKILNYFPLKNILRCNKSLEEMNSDRGAGTPSRLSLGWTGNKQKNGLFIMVTGK